jgi:large repetitive protein
MTVSRKRAFRLALGVLLVAVVAGLAAAAAYSMAFDDGAPCPDRHPLFVCPEGSVGTPYSIQLVAHGGCTPYKFRNSVASLPPGISISSSGLVSGTPTASGTWNAWLQLISHCAGDPTADREFSFTMLAGLQITTNSVPQGATVGAPYSATLQTMLVTNLSPLTGSQPGSLTWSVLPGGSLPPGLVLANGVISGTPTTEGTFQFQVQAELDATRKHHQTYSITVRQPLVVSAAKPLATSPAPTLWEVGVPFASKLTPSGGSGTYTFAIGSGSLPTGITLGPDGALSGTPRAAGVSRAIVTVTDSEGRTLEYAANFGIAARLKVGTLLLKPGKVGKLYRSKLAATGGIAPRAWKVSVGPLPKGIRLDRTTGVLSGTPTKQGRYRVTFQVTDGLKVVASKRLRIDVLP